MTHTKELLPLEGASLSANAARPPYTVRWLRAEGAAALVLAVIVYGQVGSSWWLFAGLLIAPDLFMAGYLFGPRIGAIIYNIAHTYSVPAALAVLGILTDVAILVPVSCIWFAHIGVDRMLGYGLKLPTGFRHTDLGSL